MQKSTKNSQKFEFMFGDRNISMKLIHSASISVRTNFVSYADLNLKNSAIFAENSQNKPNFYSHSCGFLFCHKTCIPRIFWWYNENQNTPRTDFLKISHFWPKMSDFRVKMAFSALWHNFFGFYGQFYYKIVPSQ